MCGSLGLGNAARLLGVVQAVRRRFRVPKERLRIVVCAGGKPALYWGANAAAVQAEVVTLDGYVFSSSQAASRSVSWSGFLRPRSAAVYLRNSLRLRELLRGGSVSLALIDSDYHCLPLLAAGVPIVALGQAWDVLRRHKELRSPAGNPPRNMLIERADLLFQRLVSSSVLVPCFGPAAAGDPRIIPVPLIVREEFLSAMNQTRPVSPFCVLTGGSGIGSAPLLDYAARYALPVIGPLRDPAPALDGEGRPLIDRAAAVIVQGGLSSISECIARRKKMAVFPIPGHGEQLANAEEVERRGLGLRIKELSGSPESLLERLERLPAVPDGARPRADGAETAAAVLLKKLGVGAA
jgi:hypothetical protein